MIGISLIALFCFFFRPRANLRRTKTEGKKATPCSADSPSFRSPPASVLPSNPAQHEPEGYYDLAVRVKHLSPPDCIWLQSDAVQITDTTAFSSGGFSEVWRGSFQDLPVAVKSLRCYSSPDFDPADVGIRFLKEVWASSQLSHQNLVRFLGVYSTPSHPFALLYELMDGLDLHRYLAQHPNVNRLKIITEVSRALKYMHSRDIIHGNVKLRNVLVDNGGVAHLGGLGSAFALSLPASWSDVGAEKLFCGVAPELISPLTFGLVHARTTKATDMFAFGIFAWEVFTGKPPFPGRIEATVFLSVFNNDRPSRPSHPQVSDRVWSMIQSCWSGDRFQRMTAAEVVDLLEAEA